MEWEVVIHMDLVDCMDLVDWIREKAEEVERMGSEPPLATLSRSEVLVDRI